MDPGPLASTPDGCFDLAALDALASRTDEPDPDVAEHLDACERCRALLDEMRRANRFLQRFRTGGCGEQADTLPDPASIRIRGYDIQAVLAFGGQGTVYRAVQAGTGRPVAIKVPLGDTLRRPSARYRFQREIELTARLSHPGIVRVLGSCELADGRVGCVMEFIEGQPFDRWAQARRREGRAAVRQIVDAGARVADAIAFAHQRAVLHRDIKPSNVVVASGGTPHVLDFGLAKALDDSAASFATLTGAFVGTLSYSAPEQVSVGADAIDMRTDIYALGLLLYQALTGRLPLDPEAPTTEIIRQIREVLPVRPSSLSPGVGDELDAIVLKALAKEKDRRYASAAEMRDDLRSWLEGGVVRARFDSRWYILRKTIRRHRWGVLLAGAGVIAIGTTATLGLVAREQFSRARLADAVRDARVLESHWVRLADARATAIDNFEAGEHAAWDALLEPESVLLDDHIEGVGEGGPNPAYWALWEMYQRTPIVFTVPTTERVLASLNPETGVVIVGRRGPGRLQWWDPRSRRLLTELAVPEVPDAGMLSVAPDGASGVISGSTDDTVLIDFSTGARMPLADETSPLTAAAWNDRALGIARSDDGSHQVLLWDTAARPPALIRRYAMPDRAGHVAFDPSGRYFAAITLEGHLIIADARSGEPIFTRSSAERPRFTAVHSRGNPGELFLYGPERIALVDPRDPAPDIANAQPRTGFLEGVRSISTGRDTNRYVVLTDRWRVGVGNRRAPITEGRLLPAISAASTILSHDGSLVCALIKPSARAAVLSLDGEGVRRLPFPAPITTSGYPTVFDIEFTPDSRTLIAGAMDGSVRTFDVRSGAPTASPREPIGRGVTAVRSSGQVTFAGTHDMGLGDAAVVRIDQTGTHMLVSDQRWFCGLELEPGVALWALTGDGHVLRVNPETGQILTQTRLERNAEAGTRTLARIPSLGLLIAGPAADGIVLLDEETLRPRGPSVPTRPIRRVVVSPADPTLIATAADDGMVRLWRAKAGPPATLEPVGTFGAHAGAIFGLAFSPDGRLLATGGGAPESRDLRLWDVQHGRELAALDLFEMGIFDVAFSPDGRWLAAGGEVRLGCPEDGGQLFLIDLAAPDRCIAGNLEYHIARFTEEHGREPGQAGPLRRWAEQAAREADQNAD